MDTATVALTLAIFSVAYSLFHYLSRRKEYNLLDKEVRWHRDKIKILENHEKLQWDKVKEIDNVLAKHVEAAGFIWKTASGYVVTVKQMSTNHLRNTLSMFRSRRHEEPFLSMQAELDRRKEDAEWEEKTAWKYENAPELPPKRRPVYTRDILEELDLWLAGRGGRGISVNTVRKKLADIVHGR